MNEVQAKIKAAKDALAAQATARKDLQAKTAEADELRKLEQQLTDNAAIMKAEAELGTQGVHFGCVTVPDGRVLILKRVAYARHREFQEKTDTSTDDLEGLVEEHVYYPEFKAYDRMQEEFPGLLQVCAKVLAKLSGALAEEAAKK